MSDLPVFTVEFSPVKHAWVAKVEGSEFVAGTPGDALADVMPQSS